MNTSVCAAKADGASPFQTSRPLSQQPASRAASPTSTIRRRTRSPFGLRRCFGWIRAMAVLQTLMGHAATYQRIDLAPGNPWVTPGNVVTSLARSLNSSGFISGQTWVADDLQGWRIGSTAVESTPTFHPAGLNASGVLAGERPGLTLGSASVWVPGQLPVTLSVPGGANDINDAGLVVGYATSEGLTKDQYCRALLWRNFLNPWTRISTELRSLTGKNAEALAINNQGFAAGWATGTNGVRRAVLWDLERNTITQLDAVEGRSSVAWDLNDSQIVVGRMLSSAEQPTAFKRDPAQVGLRTLRGLDQTPSEARAINRLGWIAGRAVNPSGIWQAFVLDARGLLTWLPSDEQESAAYDINDSNQVVGWYRNADGHQRACLWERQIAWSLSAGPPQMVPQGSLVSLQGTVTPSTVTGITVSWRQIPAPGSHGPPARVQLAGVDSLPTSFFAPFEDLTLYFELTAQDPYGREAVATTRVTVAQGLATALYVSGSQGDDSVNAGTSAAPLRTIQRALALANARGLDEAPPLILVESGDYLVSRPLEITRPVHLFGGFSFSDGLWARDATTPTHLTGQGPTTLIVRAGVPDPVPFDGADQVILDGFEVSAADGVEGDAVGESPGGSSTCIQHLAGKFTARHNVLRPGRGGAGSAGAPGADGARGEPGSNAAPGEAFATPGRGGASPNGRLGGRGGTSGGERLIAGLLADLRDAGVTEVVSALIDLLTRFGQNGLPGGDGQPGVGQAMVDRARGGAAPYDDHTDWCGLTPIPFLPEIEGAEGETRGAVLRAAAGAVGDGGQPGKPGEPGRQGDHGHGGSGGGGGGSHCLVYIGWGCIPWCDLVLGGAGGGGGAGGVGGHGGSPGAAGGDSTGILIGREAGTYWIVGNTFHLNDGGAGGSGGRGGLGGFGNLGGAGTGPQRLSILGGDLKKAGRGGWGQSGQPAGDGGHGGGGGGGGSYGVFSGNGDLVDFAQIESNTYVLDGAGGGGGTGDPLVPESQGAIGRQEHWHNLTVPLPRPEWLEQIQDLPRNEMAAQRLNLPVDIKAVSVRLDWVGQPVFARLRTPSGMLLDPDLAATGVRSLRTAGRAEFHLRTDQPGAWDLYLSRDPQRLSAAILSLPLTADANPAQPLQFTRDTDVIITLGVLRNRRPVVRVQDLSLQADPDGRAEGTIDTGTNDPDPGDAITVRQIPPGPYPVGTTTVRLEAVDLLGEVSSQAATVTVHDVSPPWVDLPDTLLVASIAPGATTATLTVGVRDNADAHPSVQAGSDTPVALDPFTQNLAVALPSGYGNYDLPVLVSDASGNRTEKTVRIVHFRTPQPTGLRFINADFDEGSIDPFVPIEGRWVGRDGYLAQIAPTAGRKRAWLDLGPARDYTISLDVLTVQGDIATVLFAHADEGYDYRVDIGLTHCRLTLPAAGAPAEDRSFIVEAPNPMPAVPRRTKVAVANGGVRVYLDDTLVLDQPWADGIPLADGHVGLGTSDSIAYFDNVSIVQEAQVTPGFLDNPGFEADTFSTWPGYVQDNGPITGWTAQGGVGLNPAGDGSQPPNSLADNGAVPEGRQVAFLQGIASIRTTLRELTPGALYRVVYRANSRAGDQPGDPWLEVRIDGVTVDSARLVPPVSGLNPYHRRSSRVFGASADTATLEFAVVGPAGEDQSVLLDDVSAQPLLGPGLQASLQEGQLLLEWPRGSLLQTSDSIDGLWQDVQSPTHPLRITPTTTRFYRLAPD